MRKLIATIALAVGLFAFPAIAEEVKIDLSNICEPGCVAELDLSTASRFPGDHESFPGQFKPSAIENPMWFARAARRIERRETVFVLVSEPGEPEFQTLDDVRAYMVGHDELLKRNRPTS